MSGSSSLIPHSVVLKAEKASELLVPKKSEHLYIKEYDRFHVWMVKNGVTDINGTVMLAYFQDLSQSCSPNTFWTKFSMVKCMLQLRDQVDISNYHELEVLIKHGYELKKSAVLTREQVETFLKGAPNDTNLINKVVVLMGMFGCCSELVKMRIEDIDDRGSVIVVQIPDTKTTVGRSFSIVEEENVNALAFIRQYVSLRPTRVSRFFLSYRNGKCPVQSVGNNTFGKIPFKISAYLGLVNPNLYTGDCLRRSSATLAAD